MRSLDQLHPTLKEAVPKIIDAMKLLGYTMIVTDTLRTTQEQQALYAQGRTTIGPGANPKNPLGSVVTNADGVIKKSNHQAHADGLGHAVDMCFVVDGVASWSPSLPWKLYGEMAKALGCSWGGDWTGKLVDRPHIEVA